MIREPGDLPIRPHISGICNLSATEVDMLADMNSKSVALPITGSSRMVAALFAALFGAIPLFGMGFAQSGVLHMQPMTADMLPAFPATGRND